MRSRLIFSLNLRPECESLSAAFGWIGLVELNVDGSHSAHCELGPRSRSEDAADSFTL